MSALKQWMDEEARALAQSLARINLNEMDARSMGGYGLRTRAITFLETVKSALFPALYEVDAATPGHWRIRNGARLRAIGPRALDEVLAAAGLEVRRVQRAGNARAQQAQSLLPRVRQRQAAARGPLRPPGALQAEERGQLRHGLSPFPLISGVRCPYSTTAGRRAQFPVYLPGRKCYNQAEFGKREGSGIPW